jgi:hypothetical protein
LREASTRLALRGVVFPPGGPGGVERGGDLLDAFDQRPDRQAGGFGQHHGAHVVGVVVGQLAGPAAEHPGLAVVQLAAAQRGVDLGQAAQQVVGQIQPARGHRPRPPERGGGLVAGELVEQRPAAPGPGLGAPGLGAPGLVQRGQQPGRGLVAGPETRPRELDHLRPDQPGRIHRVQHIDQPRRVQRPRRRPVGDPVEVLDAHEPDARPDPRHSRTITDAVSPATGGSSARPLR